MKTKIYIKWMHCISCEIILSKELSQLEWFKLHNINHKKWLLEANFHDNKQLDKAIKIIEKHNFTVSKSEKQEITSNNNQNNINAILIKFITLFSLGILFYISSLFLDIYQYLPSDNSLSFTATAMMWIIASISTCLAVTWWIIIGFSKVVTEKWDSIKSKLSVQVLFQLGRILGFFLLGGLLWIIWQSFSINLQVTTILTLLVSFLLIYIWLQTLWVLPNITKLWVHLPKSFAHKIMKFKDPKFAPFIWAMTFFLPCWFTQTAQLIAISSWDFITGWLIMWAFAIGTFPVLFLVGLWTSYFSNKKFPIIEMILWSVILIFWVITFTNAYNLLPALFKNTNTQEKVINNNTEFETVYFKHNGWNIVWNSINLEPEKNYRVIITPERNGMWCMWTLTIPTLNNKVFNVQAGVPIIYELVKTQPWVHKIVCSSMGMVQWAIIIE